MATTQTGVVDHAQNHSPGSVERGEPTSTLTARVERAAKIIHRNVWTYDGGYVELGLCVAAARAVLADLAQAGAA